MKIRKPDKASAPSKMTSIAPLSSNATWPRGKRELLHQIKQLSGLVELVYVRQGQPLGNGHAVLCARDVIGPQQRALKLSRVV